MSDPCLTLGHDWDGGICQRCGKTVVGGKDGR